MSISSETSPIVITEVDIRATVANAVGNSRFAEALKKAAQPDRILRLLARYIHFNSTFGAGVAHLAGRIGVRQDLFRDAEEPLTLLADRSMDVAADIFAAAIDEFGGMGHGTDRSTHRNLALATLKASAEFFGGGEAGLRAATVSDPPTDLALSRAMRGYGVGAPDEESILFRAIGFHIGSEILADEEFGILDKALRQQFPDLVCHLEQAAIVIDGVRNPAYIWIELHTSVEADHFAFAVAGANRALRYYAGGRTAETVRADILAGVGEFADVQAAFMASLTEN